MSKTFEKPVDQELEKFKDLNLKELELLNDEDRKEYNSFRSFVFSEYRFKSFDPPNIKDYIWSEEKQKNIEKFFYDQYQKFKEVKSGINMHNQIIAPKKFDSYTICPGNPPEKHFFHFLELPKSEYRKLLDLRDDSGYPDKGALTINKFLDVENMEGIIKFALDNYSWFFKNMSMILPDGTYVLKEREDKKGFRKIVFEMPVLNGKTQGWARISAKSYTPQMEHEAYQDGIDYEIQYHKSDIHGEFRKYKTSWGNGRDSNTTSFYEYGSFMDNKGWLGHHLI